MYTSLLMLLGSCVVGQNPADDGKRPLVWAADPSGGIPYIFKNEKDEFVGFEVDLKDALAKELGRPIVFKHYDFEKLYDGLDRNDFDFAMNGLEIVRKNLQRARFTRPYYLYQLQLVVREGDTRFATLEEAWDQEKDVKIGTLDGSAAKQLLKDSDLDLVPYEDQDPAFDDLKLGRTDAVLMDLPICMYYALSKLPPAKSVQPSPHFLKYAKRIRGLAFAGTPFAEGFYGIAVRKDNAQLAEQLNSALESLLQKGDLKLILEKWDLWNANQYWVYNHKDKKFGKENRKRSKDGKPGPVARNVRDDDQDDEPEKPLFWSFTKVLLAGSYQTVKITFKSMLLAIILALPIALSRMYGPMPIRWLAGVYVEFFRGIPVLFLLYFFYFGLPHFHSSLAGISAETVAVLAFGLNYAAYEAEVYRAGISAVPLGQWEAAASLGMTPWQTFWRIVLPQSVKGILPPMTNDLVSLFKDTSLVAAITIADLNANYRDLYRDSGGYLPIALTTAALYLIMSVPLGFLSRYLEKRWGTH